MTYNDDNPTISTICNETKKYLEGNNNLIGKKIYDHFCNTMNTTITDIRSIGGGMNNHYDFQIKIKDNDKWYNVESKHTRTLSPVNKFKLPWDKSVQVLNGIGKHYNIGMIYAEEFYKILPDIKEHYKIKAAIPNFDEWSKDAFKCGDPKTQFVCELKNTYRTLYPGKTSLNGYKHAGIDWRTKYLEKVLERINNNDIKTEFLIQINSRLSEIFNDKHYFLTTSGNIINNDFNVRWWSSINFINFTNVEFIKKKDIIIKYSNSNKTLKGVLRWGKGCGFTNIRVDAK